MTTEVLCGECGALMILRKSPRFKSPFYGCSRFPECRGSHGAHPDGRPLGIPANKATKEARIKAHEYFDRLWLSTITMTRRKAYKMLAERMGVAEIHIGESDIATCKRIIEVVEQFEKEQNAQRS